MRRALCCLVAIVTVGACAGAIAVPVHAAPGGVSAFERDGDGTRPCPRLERDAFAGIVGGCELFARSSTVRMTVLTMFGPLAFARCDVQFNLYIGPRGDTLMTNVTTFGIEANSACGDVVPCRRDLIESLPWRGRIVAAGTRLRNVVDACLDTCMGRFEGRLTIPIGRDGLGWRMRAAKSLVGISGLQLDGTWMLEGPKLDLRRR